MYYIVMCSRISRKKRSSPIARAPAMKADRSGKSSTRAWGKFQRMGVISRTYHVLGLLVAVRRYAVLFLRPLPKVLPVHTIPRSPPPLLQSRKTGPPLRFRKNVASGVVLGLSTKHMMLIGHHIASGANEHVCPGTALIISYHRATLAGAGL